EAKFFTPEEASVFLDMAGKEDDRLFALYLMAVTLGMREGELLGLRWSDVDMDAQVIRISQNLQRNPANNGRLELKETKTVKSKRSLPLTDDLRDALRRHKARQTQDRLLAGPDKWVDCGLVFTTRNGTPIRASNLLKGYKRLLVRAGLEERRFHDLRHSTASFLLARGVPMKVISELLGHSDTKVTSEIYSHILPGMTKDVVEEVTRLLKTG
ncbi:MAG: site-specific integrase, partial [Armatimonadetes bacterium]|nr:site-specific integrase [Armatimonadota bacterium]